MHAAASIGCSACIDACHNASAMLFTGAKVTQLSLLPQGYPERRERALNIVRRMDVLGFGNGTNERECEAACHYGDINSSHRPLNRKFIKAALLAE